MKTSFLLGKYNNSSFNNKKTLVSIDQEASSVYSARDKDVISNMSGPSLKGKFGILFDSIQQISTDLEEHRKSFKTLNDKKDKIKASVTMKTENVQKGLILEIEKVEKEMERHFSHQNAENSRLQQQISQLKSEKVVVQNSLSALQRRIADLELQIGENKNE